MGDCWRRHRKVKVHGEERKENKPRIAYSRAREGVPIKPQQGDFQTASEELAESREAEKRYRRIKLENRYRTPEDRQTSTRVIAGK